MSTTCHHKRACDSQDVPTNTDDAFQMGFHGESPSPKRTRQAHEISGQSAFQDAVQVLTELLGVGCGVGWGVGTGVGGGVGTGVGAAVGIGVGAAVGIGVGAAVGEGVGIGVGAEVGEGVGARVGIGVGARVGAFVAWWSGGFNVPFVE
jgi:hypothetical protein